MINFLDINPDVFDKVPTYSVQIGESLLRDLGIATEELESDENSQKLFAAAVIILLSFNLLMNDQEFAEFDKVRETILLNIREDMCASGHTV